MDIPKKSRDNLKLSAVKANGLLAEQCDTQTIAQNVNEIQQTGALLKILALGNREVKQGKCKPITEVIRRLRRT